MNEDSEVLELLNRFHALSINDKKHFPECYMVVYPDDPDVYCTCHDWAPEI